MDDQCKQLKSKMDKVLQSCANQHLVSKDVYTEKPSKTEIWPLAYSISVRYLSVLSVKVYSQMKGSSEDILAPIR